MSSRLPSPLAIHPSVTIASPFLPLPSVLSPGPNPVVPHPSRPPLVLPPSPGLLGPSYLPWSYLHPLVATPRPISPFTSPSLDALLSCRSSLTPCRLTQLSTAVRYSLQPEEARAEQESTTTPTTATSITTLSPTRYRRNAHDSDGERRWRRIWSGPNEGSPAREWCSHSLAG